MKTLIKRTLRICHVRLQKNDDYITVVYLPEFMCNYLEAKNNVVTRIAERIFIEFGFKDATY